MSLKISYTYNEAIKVIKYKTIFAQSYPISPQTNSLWAVRIQERFQGFPAMPYFNLRTT